MSAQLTLYHFPLDPASRQVRLALGEKRLAYEDVVEKVWEQRPEFVKLNPAGMTPVLVVEEDGEMLTVCEARAIVEYLEDVHPEPPLLGREPGERAEARRLMHWFDRKFDNEVNGFLLREKMEKRLYGRGAPHLGTLRQGLDALREHLRYMEELLDERDWLAGKRLSLADFAAAGNISIIDYFGDVPWRQYPAVKTWYAKLKSRPCFRPLLADRWPGMVPAGHYDDLDF